MSTLDTILINKEIWDLWERTFLPSRDDVFVPLQYPPARKDALLFVGLNPSFSDDAFSILKDTQYRNLQPRQFYLWSNRSKFDFSVDAELDRVFRDKYPYFSKFKQISHECKLDWEYADLFFYRCTNQKDFKTIIQNSRGQLNQFAHDQLNISWKFIVGLEPRVIVVANAFASHVFSDTFQPTYDNHLGYHLTRINDNLVPTFLASMFTGQRAMDVYSFQRLKWFIRKTLSPLNQ